MKVEDHLVAHEGLGIVLGRDTGLFYEDSSVVGSRDPEWLQGALNMLIVLFRWYILLVNVENSKSTTFHTGTLRYGMPEEEV